MPIITIVVVLIVVGVILWAVNTMVPMAYPYKRILNVIVALLVFLWIIHMLGIWHGPGMELR